MIILPNVLLFLILPWMQIWDSLGPACWSKCRLRIRSDTPLLAGGRGGGSPRHSEASFGWSSAGDWGMHRYLANSTRSLLNGGSSTSGLDSHLRSRVLSRHSEQMSHLSPLPSQPMSLTMQTALHSTSPSRPLAHPPLLQGSSLHSLLPPPSPLGPGPSRLPSSPPLNPLSFALSKDSLSSPTNLFQGSSLHGLSPGGLHEGGLMSTAEGLLGMPFRGLQMPIRDGGSQPCLVAKGLAKGSLGTIDEDKDTKLLERSKQLVCKHYKKGNCKFATKCKFTHSEDKDVSLPCQSNLGSPSQNQVNNVWIGLFLNFSKILCISYSL